jgi:hypothetical protein
VVTVLKMSVSSSSPAGVAPGCVRHAQTANQLPCTRFAAATSDANGRRCHTSLSRMPTRSQDAFARVLVQRLPFA